MSACKNEHQISDLSNFSNKNCRFGKNVDEVIFEISLVDMLCQLPLIAILRKNFPVRSQLMIDVFGDFLTH